MPIKQLNKHNKSKAFCRFNEFSVDNAIITQCFTMIAKMPIKETKDTINENVNTHLWPVMAIDLMA